jgi:hypothetical protein
MLITGAAVVSCLSARWWRSGRLADAGTRLAATSYSPTTADPSDTEYGFVLGAKK